MTDIAHTTKAIALSPLPDPGPPRAALAQQRYELAQSMSDRTAAADCLEASLRAGLWRYARLWLHFAELPTDPSDHARLKDLWLDSPKACRTMRSAMTVVARAAAVAGEHDDAHVLMRKALLRLAVKRRRLRARLRMRRDGGSRIPVPALVGTDPATEASRTYFALYEAMSTDDRTAIADGIAALRRLGQGAWLERL